MVVREDFASEDDEIDRGFASGTASLGKTTIHVESAYKFVQENFTHSNKDAGFDKLPVLTAECNYSQRASNGNTEVLNSNRFS